MRICQPPENVSLGFPRSSWRKPEAAQDGRDLQIDAVALLATEGFLQLAVACEHGGVLGLVCRVVREALLERRDLGPHVEQRLEREPRLFEQRAAGVQQAVLRQVADREARRLDDEAGVGLLQPGQHLEKGRLAGAVRPAQADALAIVDLPAD